MTGRVVHPAELERMLEARVKSARTTRPASHRSAAAASRRPRFRRGPAVAAVGLLLALSATAVFADGGALDVQVADSTGYAFDTTTDDAIVEYIGKDNEDFGSSGTGVINSFLQTQDTPSEEGYNTDGTRQFDTGSSPTFNRSILVSQIPVVECEALDEAIDDPAEMGLCWELFADINDSNANDPDAAQIQLTELEVWLTTNKNITGYVQTGDLGFPSGANEVYDFEGTVLINDVNSGSGRGDLRYLVPLSAIDLATLAPNCAYGSTACATYFVVYTEWGDTDAAGNYISDSGFEEWTVKRYPSLQIVKNTLGGDASFDFEVTGDPTDPPDTSPTITTVGGTGSTPGYVIDPGTYTIDELTPSGWTLTGAVCRINGGTAQAYTEDAELDIDDDDHVVCTFTNEQQGKIITDKVTIPAGDSQMFDFAASWDSGTDPDFQLADATTPNDSGFLAAGTYSVAETVPTGWALTSATCDDGSDPSSIDLAAGETVTCTFTNTKQAKILVDKVTTPSGSAQQFEFDPNYSGTNFFLDDDDPLNDSGFLAPGSYSVGEVNIPSGWALTSATCDDGSPVTAIVLAAGETVTCTFRNEQQGKIITDKVTIPAGDSQMFDFAASWDSGTDPDFQLADATTPNDSGFLAAGTYSVAETVPTGWALTSATCDDGSDPSSIDLAAGETVTCTFTNTKLPTIIVEKITTGTAGGPFGFTTLGGNGFSTPFDLSTVTPGVAVATSFQIASAGIGGDYSVTESSMPAGFVLTDVDCTVTTAGVAGTTTGQDLATKTGTIMNLTAGTTVTCTFVNSGALTTRTQGFWSTHSWLVEIVWEDPDGGTIDTFVFEAMTDAERTLCGHVLTFEEVMGGFWSNIAKQTDGDKRTKLDQARMQLAQQLLAAILNNQLFGSAPSGAISIDDAKDAFCTGDVAAVKAAASAMAAFNEGGDSGEFTPGGSADAKHAREIADLVFWDDLP